MKLGKLSESVLNRSILKPIKTKGDFALCGAAVGNDCALFALSDGASLATAMQEGALAVEAYPCGFPVSNLIHKAVNNLLVKYAKPLGIELCFLFPEELEEARVKQVSAEVKACCDSLGIDVFGGQSCVSAQVKAPFAVVTAYGEVSAEHMAAAGQELRPGMEIVLSKWIGLEGTALLAGRFKDRLQERFPASLVEEAESFGNYLSLIPEAATAVKSGVCRMHDASKGGILGALWELAQGAGVGLNMDFKKLPIRQETVEVCEELGVNPYKLLSGGCLIMVTDRAAGLVEELSAQGIPAVSIGTITAQNDRVLHNEEELRYLEKAGQDEIYRIFAM